MRRISKPKLPRNVSPKGQKPCSMQEAEHHLRATLPSAKDPTKHARTLFDSLDKKKLRKVLYEEQRRVCIYCERQLKEESKILPSEVPPIDHWRPIRNYPELALHWKNLHLSCSFQETCDTLKDDNRLVWDEADNDLPWPSDASYEDWLGFTPGGDVYVRVDAPLSEATRKALDLALDHRDDGRRRRTSTLRLNHPALIEARKAAIDEEQRRMARDFKDQHASPAERKARADKMLQDEVYPAFISIRVAYLRRMLGRHQEPEQ